VRCFEDIPQLKQTLHVKETVQYQPSALVLTRCDLPNRRCTMLLEHYNNGLGACLADDMGLEKHCKPYLLWSLYKKN
jgi:non-specific serine/threonine protein kinase